MEDDEGCQVYLIKTKMPPMISDRSTLTTFYNAQLPDGTNVVMNSSRGNEHLIRKYKSKLKKTVLTDNVLILTGYKEVKGGMELCNIIKVDPKGMVP